MEALILIPIAVIIYGWVKSTPSIEPPPGANGYDYPCYAGYGDDDTTWGTTIDDGMIINDEDSTAIYFSDFGTDDYEFMQSNILDDDHIDFHTDLYFDPVNSWYDDNIYHHDNDF